MDNAGYVALNRQSGLLREMQTVAQNIANASTTGYRKEGVIFAEFVADAGSEGSLSMANGAVRRTDLSQAPLAQTGGRFDLALEGEGFFLIATPQGPQLTRAGSFGLSPEGDLVTADGMAVLDGGGAGISVPAGAVSIAVSGDGTMTADGQPFAQIGAWMPAEGAALTRQAGTRFSAEGEPVPAAGTRIMQGYLEGSNVDPVSEIARMIEVQRAYELGQTLLDREDQRIRAVMQTLGR